MALCRGGKIPAGGAQKASFLRFLCTKVFQSDTRHKTQFASYFTVKLLADLLSFLHRFFNPRLRSFFDSLQKRPQLVIKGLHVLLEFRFGSFHPC